MSTTIKPGTHVYHYGTKQNGVVVQAVPSGDGSVEYLVQPDDDDRVLWNPDNDPHWWASRAVEEGKWSW